MSYLFNKNDKKQIKKKIFAPRLRIRKMQVPCYPNNPQY